MTVGRLAATTAARMFAPLLGVVAVGLGVSLVTAGVFVAVFEAGGLLGPGVGWCVDRVGARQVLLVGQVGFAVAAIVCAASWSVWVFGLALAAMGVCAALFESAATALISAATPFAVRAAWLGRLDLAWPGGLLVGLPVVALLAELSWRAPFVAVGAVAGASVVPLAASTRSRGGNVAVGDRQGWGGWWSMVRSGRGAFGGFGLLALSSQMVIVVYGVWLGTSFGFSTAAIGAVGFVLGVADLLAAVVNIRLTDVVGKVSAATIGVSVLAVGSMLLLIMHEQLAFGLVGLVLMLAGYEYALLAIKPMLAEIDPHNPGRGIGLGFGAAAAARGVGAIVGTALYATAGVRGAATASAVVAGLVFVIVVTDLSEPTSFTSGALTHGH